MPNHESKIIPANLNCIAFVKSAKSKVIIIIINSTSTFSQKLEKESLIENLKGVFINIMFILKLRPKLESKLCNVHERTWQHVQQASVNYAVPSCDNVTLLPTASRREEGYVNYAVPIKASGHFVEVYFSEVWSHCWKKITSPFDPLIINQSFIYIYRLIICFVSPQPGTLSIVKLWTV